MKESSGEFIDISKYHRSAVLLSGEIRRINGCCKMFDAPLKYPLYYRLRCFGWAFFRFLWHGVSIQKGAFERLRNRQ